MTTRPKTGRYARHLLGAKLAGFRAARNLRVKDIADVAEMQTSGWGKVERGESATSVHVIRAVIDFYEIVGDEREELIELARAAQQRDWWTSMRSAAPERHDRIIGTESYASKIQIYHNELVPGPLQTPEYTEAIQTVMVPEATPAETEGLIAVRQERSTRLLGNGGPKLEIILHELVIRNPVGSDEVMRLQRQRLAEIAKLPNVTLRVLLLGPHPAMNGAFRIQSFEDYPDLDTVVIDGDLAAVYQDGAEALHRYRWSFARVGELALSPSATLDLLS